MHNPLHSWKTASMDVASFPDRHGQVESFAAPWAGGFEERCKLRQHPGPVCDVECVGPGLRLQLAHVVLPRQVLLRAEWVLVPQRKQQVLEALVEAAVGAGATRDDERETELPA